MFKSKHYITSFLLLFLLIVFNKQAIGQLYPVNANLIINPPGTIYLTDYTQTGSQKMMLNLMLNDFNETSYDVALNIRIEGGGIRLQTSGNFMPSPLTLSPGMNSFTGAQLAEYFNPANMDVQGIDKMTLMQNNTLPEGMYTFCVEVTDFRRRDVKLSTQQCATLLLQRNYPPLTVFPSCGSTVPSSGMQNVQFQWQARHNLSIQAEYLLTIVQMPPGMNANDAMLASQTPLLDKEVVMTNSFIYGPSQVPLEMGKSYAYRIDVRDPMMQVTFENGGIGEVCYFTYGYGNGTLELTGPADQTVIKATEKPFLKWNGPTNAQSGMQIYYKITVSEITGTQTPTEALQFNSPLVVENTSVVPQLNNWNFLVNNQLPTEKKYAWKVEAIAQDQGGTGNEQKIAESQVWSFRSAPSVPDFWAANGTVKVEVLTTNGTLPDNLSGEGLVKIDPNKPPVKVTFSNLKVDLRTTTNVLRQGIIDSPIDETKVELKWDDAVKENGKVNFVASHIVLDASHFNLRGKVEWNYPLATTAGAGKVNSRPKVVQYDNYQLRTDVQGIEYEPIAFDLLDPHGFKVDMKSSSTFHIYDQVLTTKIQGEVHIPSTVKSESGSRIKISFTDANNPYHYTNTQVTNAILKPINNLDLTADIKSVVFDFSEEKSDGVKKEKKDWKGLNIMKYEFKAKKDFDNSNQLTLNSDITFEVTQTEESSVVSWVDASGLDFIADRLWNPGSGPKAVMNTFDDEVTSFLVHIEDNLVKDGALLGFIKMPVLDDDEPFFYNLPIRDHGVGLATLADFTGRKFVINEFDDYEEVTITIKSAVFKNKSHVDMTIDFDWPGIYADVNDLTGFKVWGDGSVGFNQKNGLANLSTQAASYLPGNKTFGYVIESIRAINDGGHFGFITKGAVAIKGHVASVGGHKFKMSVPTRRAVKNGGSFPALPFNGNHAWNKFLDAGISYEKGTFTAAFKVDFAIFKSEGMVMYKPDDEVWGDAFFAFLYAKVGYQGIYEAEAFVQFLLGKKFPDKPNEFTYWFAEAGLGSITRAENWYETQYDKIGQTLPMVGKGSDENAGNGSYGKYLVEAVDQINNTGKALEKVMRDMCLDENRNWYRNWRASRAHPKLRHIEELIESTLTKLNADNIKEPEVVADLNAVKEGCKKAREMLSGNWLKYKNECGQGPGVPGLESNLEKIAKVKKAVKEHREKKKNEVKDKVKQSKRDRIKTGLTDKYEAKKSEAKANVEKGKAVAKKKGISKMGIPIPPIAWITGLQGRIYYHMSRDLSTGTIKGIDETERKLAAGGKNLKAAKNAQDQKLSSVDRKTCKDPGFDTKFPNPFQEMQMPYYPSAVGFTYEPDKDNFGGIMAMASFMDMPFNGMLLDGYGSLELSTNGFRAEVEANLGNFSIPMVSAGSFVNAYLAIFLDIKKGELGGDFLFKTNPLFCGGGDGTLRLDYKGNDKYFQFRLGHPHRKVWMMPGCIGIAARVNLDFYIGPKKAYLEGGLGVRLFAGLQTPDKLGLGDFASIEAYAGVSLTLDLDAKLHFKPNFRVERIGFRTEAWAGACISGEVINLVKVAVNVVKSIGSAIGSVFSGKKPEFKIKKEYISFYKQFEFSAWLAGEVYTKDDEGKDWAAKGEMGVSKRIMGKNFSASMSFDKDL